MLRGSEGEEKYGTTLQTEEKKRERVVVKDM